jgi:hypothetical protein
MGMTDEILEREFSLSKEIILMGVVNMINVYYIHV